VRHWCIRDKPPGSPSPPRDPPSEDLPRLDRSLVDRGLATTRSRAQELVRRGAVRIDGRVVRRAGARVGPGQDVTVDAPLRFVSRGGDKLDHALSELGIDVAGRRCLDIGASTGGFTHCLLERGAATVCAVDVGHGQLAPTLQADPRVRAMDGMHARDLTPDDLPFPPEVVVVDASFISLTALAPTLARLAPPGAQLLALVKPQFEVGAAEARRTRGVVRQEPLRQRAIARVRAALEAEGFQIRGGVDSVILGPRGNREYFVHAARAER
jgi:23S rRNA (cytidine1920-2'-O)/16S rRNA (cytidine1409-2'-O)-methyltransferase